ncbi:MAG: hypothetical protein DHS20C18_25080 [Saprospiraceae bacterium]|nr:MAG: hypothetical protein DHS20C18_25080 [Saprospiraceae bacterium]
MTELEKYILEQREALDQVEKPRVEQIWKGIQQEKTNLEPTSGWHLQIGKFWKWSLAASFALLISMGIGLYLKTTSGAQQVDLADYYPELAKQEEVYRQMVAQKEAGLELNNEEKIAFRDILSELDQLDKLHKESLADVPQYVDNDRLVETLLRYYERKIRILERLSKEIEKQKNNENRESKIHL